MQGLVIFTLISIAFVVKICKSENTTEFEMNQVNSIPDKKLRLLFSWQRKLKVMIQHGTKGKQQRKQVKLISNDDECS